MTIIYFVFDVVKVIRLDPHIQISKRLKAATGLRFTLFYFVILSSTKTNGSFTRNPTKNYKELLNVKS